MLDAWAATYPDRPPVAHLLREAFPDRWVRFHALPGSRRYPADEAEYATILGRYNTILGTLTCPRSAIVLLTTGYSRDAEPPALRVPGPAVAPWWSFLYNAGDDLTEPTYWHVHAAEQIWRPGMLDPIFRRVVDDEVRNVMVVSPDCRWLFYPYDGGMDLILDSPATRDHLRATHPAWLSPRPDEEIAAPGPSPRDGLTGRPCFSSAARAVQGSRGRRPIAPWT